MAGETPQCDPRADAEFDAFADGYDAALERGLSLTGEDKSFFAEGRMRWLKRRLDAAGFHPGRAMDFGCGTGGSVPGFFDILGADEVTGVDPSGQSLARARAGHGGRARATFVGPGNLEGAGTFDLAFCNGVFHHIPVGERGAAARFVWEALRPGGIFAFWENNGWNPATRFVMSRVPFDRDAVLVFPAGARKLLRGTGFEIMGTDFLFIFPRPLARLRPLEPALCRLPLGGQYLVLARKPEPGRPSISPPPSAPSTGRRLCL